jgi:elongation factor G
MGASYDKSFASILERLTPKAVQMQMPIGSEADFDGIIDLLTMKEVKFTGEKGKDVSFVDILPEHLEEAKRAP